MNPVQRKCSSRLLTQLSRQSACQCRDATLYKQRTLLRSSLKFHLVIGLSKIQKRHKIGSN